MFQAKKSSTPASDHPHGGEAILVPGMWEAFYPEGLSWQTPGFTFGGEALFMLRLREVLPAEINAGQTSAGLHEEEAILLR